VAQLIDLRTEPPQARTKSYVHLMRVANEICEGAELDRLAPRARSNQSNNGTNKPTSAATLDPLAMHEAIAYDWLGQGGKRARPFITLAAYDAMKGAAGTFSADGVQLPDGVRRTALAIEAFHKASLVHDDIEDDDTFRYGRATLHRQYGVGCAINVGDYLIGLGYRLVARDRQTLGGDCTADILNKLSEAHLKLSEGQGAELLWRDATEKSLTALEALKIYALKTAPAFEAALYAGLRLAGPADDREKMVAEFSRHLGVAFQILNDLKDWNSDSDNKLVAGQDVLAARPTLLLALALEGSAPAERAAILELLKKDDDQPASGPLATDKVERVRRLFAQAQVFAKAEAMVEKFRARAEAVADAVEPAELRELLYYLVDSVLDKPAPMPETMSLPLVQLTR
jgi:geranylgeranyl pyrophosphate synthase